MSTRSLPSDAKVSWWYHAISWLSGSAFLFCGPHFWLKVSNVMPQGTDLGYAAFYHCYEFTDQELVQNTLSVAGGGRVFPAVFVVSYSNLWYHNNCAVSMCVCAGVAQLCPTLCDPTDHSSPGSSVHEILQARILGCHSLLHDCEVAFNNQRKKTSANYSPSDHPSIWKHLLKFSWSFLEMRVVFLSLQDRGKWHWLL